MDTIDALIAERITLTPGGRTLVQTMKAHGAHTCLVSGGFTLFTGPISARIGFDEAHATTLGVRDGRLTGEVDRADRRQGDEARDPDRPAQRASASIPPRPWRSGDGANDLDMLGEAGLGVAFRAKPKVAAAAQVRIDHGDLTALLYLQGYAAAEFVG